MQLLDELPMIYGSTFLVYANYDLLLAANEFERSRTRNSSEKSAWQKFLERKQVIVSLLAIYCIIVTSIYLSVWKNPIFHEISYGFLVVIIIVQSSLLIRKLNSSKRIYLTSVIYYFFGFFLWNLDNQFCSSLKLHRKSVENWFGIADISESNFSNMVLNVFVVLVKSFLEFHSLWHLFTGYASYMTILFMIDLNYTLHLNKTNRANIGNKKPVDSKFKHLYYHLKNDLIENKQIKQF
jgi:dihydroceramidase